MAKRKDRITSDIGWSTSDRIVVRGLDLPNEILGHFNLGDYAYFLLTGERPTPQQSEVFNAIVITLVEHGITPSAIAARMTYLGAPESLQAAVAAGLCGLGTVFVGSMEGAAKMLYAALPKETKDKGDLAEIARATVADYRAARRSCPASATRSTSRLIHAHRDCSRSPPKTECPAATSRL